MERGKVVSGELEPPAAASKEGEAEPGIPEFWLNVLRADKTVGGLVGPIAYFRPCSYSNGCLRLYAHLL